MNRLARLITAFILLTLSAFAGEPKTVRILTIGNSFSANATRYLKDLAKAGGHTLIHNSLVIGGSSFQVHADKTKAEGKARLYSSGRDLIANLTLDHWDYVTIQQTTLGMDGHHANLPGEYLGACVWYEVLFGDSPVGLAFIPKGLDAEFARFLQETAHRAVVARSGGDSKL